MIIAFEGIDGAGKSTIIEHLKQHYETQRQVHIYQFPYGDTKWQQTINQYPNDYEYPIRVAIYWTAMSHIRNTIQSHPETDLVLLDRWDWSTPAYAPTGLTSVGVNRTSIPVANAVSVLNGGIGDTPTCTFS